MNRKIIFSVIVCMFTSSLAFCQSEVLKNIVNNLAYYKKQQDLKYLANAKKTIDSLIKSKKDSADIKKNVYKAVIYCAIAYTDSTNKLGNPPTFLRITTAQYQKWAADKRSYRFQSEMDFAARCLANTYLRLGFKYIPNNYYNALQAFKLAQQYAPSFRQVNAYIAFCYSKLGAISEAAKYYTILLDSDTIRTDYVEAAVSTYKAVGDTVKALQTLQKGRKLLPNNKSFLLEEANIYSNRQDYRSLEPLLPQLLDDNPNNPDIAFIAANCYDHLNKFDKAQSLYLRTIELNSVFFEPVFNLGLLYLRSSALKKDALAAEDVGRAARWLEKANEISPYDTKCLNLLQIIYGRTGNQAQLDKVNNKLKQLTN